MNIISQGQDVLFDVDWQGAMRIGTSAPTDVVSIFILPPSMHELEQRLRTRALDSEDIVRRRMAKATIEISHWEEYQYIIVNDDLETSVSQISTILYSERLKRHRQAQLPDLVQELGVGR